MKFLNSQTTHKSRQGVIKKKERKRHDLPTKFNIFNLSRAVKVKD